MKRTFLIHWNFIRLLRLLIGIAILVQAVISKDWLFGLAGIFFTALPLLNIGCCGENGCTIAMNKDFKKKEISYEKVV